ncbi:fibronectin type III-like domain-contianing protein [Tardisphaera saccharovorans]
MKVTFRVPAEILSFYDQYMRQIVEEGEYAVEVGSSSEDVRLSGELYVTRTLVIGIGRGSSRGHHKVRVSLYQ